jgi:hypothetical protein
MSTNVDSIVQLIRMLPSPAVEEVADFAGYLFRKYVRLEVDEQTARRKANRWLVERVGNMVVANRPSLAQVAGKPIWRFDAVVTSLSRAPRRPIGHVDVDATTGAVLTDDDSVEAMRQHGAALQ